MFLNSLWGISWYAGVFMRERHLLGRIFTFKPTSSSISLNFSEKIKLVAMVSSVFLIYGAIDSLLTV